MAKKKKRKKRIQWPKVRDLFFQRLGAVSFFVILLTILLGLLVFKVGNQTWTYLEEQRLNFMHRQEREEFIQALVPTAQRLQRQYGVLASVSMGQAILESNYGTSELGAVYHNLYGVKTDASDPDGVDYVTSEFVDDQWIEIVDRFKIYPSWDASMEEHARLIAYGTTWNPDHYQQVLDGKTYQQQAKGLQQSGYATDPDYAKKVIHLIEVWDLHQYDQPIQ